MSANNASKQLPRYLPQESAFAVKNQPTGHFGPYKGTRCEQRRPTEPETPVRKLVLVQEVFGAPERKQPDCCAKCPDVFYSA